VVINKSGQIDGYYRVDVWLPSSEQSLAQQIVSSFTLTGTDATC
jgi:hypothetical protein